MQFCNPSPLFRATDRSALYWVPMVFFVLFTFQTKKKRKRCGECIGCQKKDNCGDCAPCRNDKSHQICKQRRCEKLTDKKVSNTPSLSIRLRNLQTSHSIIQTRANDEKNFFRQFWNESSSSKQFTTQIRIIRLINYCDSFCHYK